ncbi:proton-conducting transporter membrane subunit [Sciscionella sediminilitoris]|uniref:proton-conducting transporter transmembrane domain-containing protein n=1 Tax=Sciscionella sediminilitoris TaxID=1445613 RepID=UPI0004DF344A|nr:proton-conducting transporter membrane subunit [Sciscionella sp. SE31]
MNLATAGFAAACVIGLASALLAVALPARVRVGAVGIGVVLTGAAGLFAGIGVLAGQPCVVDWPWLLPFSGFQLATDELGGVFIVVTAGVTVLVGVYSIGYTRGHLESRVAQAGVPLFVVAMLLVPAAASVGTLLVCWELMALLSLGLVVAEHRQRAGVAAAGRWYAVMTHLGFMLILIGLLVLAAHARTDSFTAVRAAAGQLSAPLAGLVFVLLVLGFGSKAGIVPLHAWLPRAHPEAPSHVSALMSAAMVNLGVYGIVRAGFDFFGGGASWWWLLVLILGAVSAVYGILQAAMSTDVKRLLGHSTTENMGLVLIGIGAAGLFTVAGQRGLAGLALGAALLHVVGHAAVKTLLFLSAGSVLRATGTRDLDELGGLRGPMPGTTAAFGWGGLALSALPPGTMFVSEWLLLQALIHGVASASTAEAIVLPVAVAAIALTAGLAVATFVKAFGIGFLARPRTEAAARPVESPPSMLIGMGLSGVLAAVLALAPGLVLPALGSAVTSVLGSGPAVTGGAVTMRLTVAAGELSPALLTVAVLAAMLLVWAGARAIAVRRGSRVVREWDCGAGPMTARMEYTATSFAEPVQRVFDNVLRPEQDVNVDHDAESRYLVRAVEYRRQVPDRIEQHLYVPVLNGIRRWGQWARQLADGSVHRYLAYGFYTVCAVLLLLAVTW